MEKASWEIYEPLRMDMTRTSRVYHPHGTSFCKCVLYLTVERRAVSYFWNFVFPTSTQVTASFMTVFLPPKDLGTKMQITVSIVLTMFAVKFTSAQYMPPVAYLTLLDKYFVFAVMVVICLMTQNAIMYILDKQGVNVVVANYSSATALFLTWCSSQVVTYLMLLSRRVRRMVMDPEINGRRPGDPLYARVSLENVMPADRSELNTV